MYRVVIKNDDHLLIKGDLKKRYWEDWLKEKKIDFEFGHRVSKSIKETLRLKIEEVNERNSRLEEENKELTQMKEIAEKLGLRLCSWNWERKVQEKLTEISQGVPDGNLIGWLQSNINTMTAIKQTFEKVLKDV
jgi:hypothetical protein